MKKILYIVQNSKRIILIYFLLISGILFTIDLKYRFGGRDIGEFDPLYLGNIFNFLIFAISVAGVIILTGIRKNKEFINSLAVIAFISVSLLASSLLIKNSDFQFLKGNLGYYTLKKVYFGAAFFLNLFFNLYFISMVWLQIFDNKTLIFLRSAYLSLTTLVIILIFTFLYSLLYKNEIETSRFNSKYDIIVILGAAVYSDNSPSPLFKGRIEKAAELYQDGISDKILVTGGNAPGEITEAQAAYLVLLKRNIPEECIIKETKTSTTAEQIKYLHDRFSTDKLLIISNDFHLARVKEMSRFYGIKADFTASGKDLSITKFLYYRLRESAALLLFWLYSF